MNFNSSGERFYQPVEIDLSHCLSNYLFLRRSKLIGNIELIFLLLGFGRQEGSNSEVPAGIINSLSDNFEDNISSNRDGHCSFNPETFLCPNILKSAFCHLKIMSPTSLIEMWVRNRQVSTCESHNKADSLLQTVGEFKGDELGSSMFSASVDPFWPLCLFELRGKCNNDECPWQHVKDYSNAALSQNQFSGSDDAGMRNSFY